MSTILFQCQPVFCSHRSLLCVLHSVDVTIRIVCDQGGQQFIYPARQVEQMLMEMVASAITAGSKGFGAGAGGGLGGLGGLGAKKLGATPAAPAAGSASSTLLKTLDSFGCDHEYNPQAGQFIKRVCMVCTCVWPVAPTSCLSAVVGPWSIPRL